MKTHPRACSLSVRLAVLPLVVASLLASVVSAQNAPGGGEDRRRRGGEGGGERGGDRGGFNPQEMQARMLAGLRERMEVKDDEEWKLISERIAKVAEMRRSAPGGPGMMMMGRGPGGPGGPGREEGGSGRGGPRPGGGSAEMTALASALRDKLPDAEIKSRLDRLRDQRKDSEAKLARAQEDLRAVLTMRQEAMAVMAGLLP